MPGRQVIASEARLCVGVFDAAIHVFIHPLRQFMPFPDAQDYPVAWTVVGHGGTFWSDFEVFSSEKVQKNALEKSFYRV